MDIGTIVGLALASTLIIGGMGAFVGAFVSLPSLLIVLGGTMGATLVFFPLDTLRGVGGIVKNVFFARTQPTSTLIAAIIERMFRRLKDFRRIATRYDKLGRNFFSAVLIAAIVIWWLN